MMSNYHIPVLLKESVDGLNIRPDGVYVDVTFGGGGHAREILSRLGPKGRLIAFDQDKDAQANAIDDARFQLIQQNFRYVKRFLRLYGYQKVDGILADFGVSSHQFDVADRGFSTRFEGVLDMRMNQESDFSAYELVNTYEQNRLAEILSNYGELRRAKGMAHAIVEAREQKAIKTTADLKTALADFLPRDKQHKILAQVYQAIRIEVNNELDTIKEFLMQTVEILPKGGRLSVISYHSLEDRLVKRFMRNGMFEGEPERDIYGRVDVPYKPVGKLIVPAAEEMEANNRARSAKLRIAEKI